MNNVDIKGEYTINTNSFYPLECESISDSDKMDKLVEQITEQYFDHKVMASAMDNWQYGCGITIYWNDDSELDKEFMEERIAKLKEDWYDVYAEAYNFALAHSDYELLEETA